MGTILHTSIFWLFLYCFWCNAGRIDEGAMRERRKQYDRQMRSIAFKTDKTRLSLLSICECGDELAAIAQILADIDLDRSYSEDKGVAYNYTVKYGLYKKCFERICEHLQIKHHVKGRASDAGTFSFVGLDGDDKERALNER